MDNYWCCSWWCTWSWNWPKWCESKGRTNCWTHELNSLHFERIEAMCTHILRGWCWTSCMSSMYPNMQIRTIAMRGSMHWMAKFMISMTCWTHSRPEMILRMTECVGCLGSCIASMCLCFCSFSFVNFSWLFLFSVDWLYKLYAFFSIFSFCWLYYVPVLKKQYAILVLFMHLFCLMNPKGEKNWKMEN